MAEADPGIAHAIAPLPEMDLRGDALDAFLDEATAPFVVRRLVDDWPLVAAARNSAGDARAYLLGKARAMPFAVSVGQAGSGGRLFYDDAMQMNFRMARASLPDIFTRMEAVEHDADAAPVYLASIDMAQFFDGLLEDTPVPLGTRDRLSSIWIGTRTRIAAHNDTPHNLACVAAGQRRFTLFPPDQFRNLYLGPLDNTPAGRTISMVDLDAPDPAAHPRFAQALRHAQAAVLDPGDAIFIPANWWHHVDGLAPFNVLVNFWWRDTPRWLGQPQDAMLHAILAIRDLPNAQRDHWRMLFDHYVFDADDAVAAHIPEPARGALGPMTAEVAGRIRAFLVRQLGR